MSAIAELLPDDVPTTGLELAPAPRRLAVPPATVPSGPVRAALRRYKAGLGTDAQLLATVDRHGEALEVEIARLATAHLREFAGHVRRLEALHARTADLIVATRVLRDTGVSVEDLAELIRVQPGTVRRWLNGKLVPSPKLALALEELLVDPAAAARILALIPLSRSHPMEP